MQVLDKLTSIKSKGRKCLQRRKYLHQEHVFTRNRFGKCSNYSCWKTFQLRGTWCSVFTCLFPPYFLLLRKNSRFPKQFLNQISWTILNNQDKYVPAWSNFDISTSLHGKFFFYWIARRVDTLLGKVTRLSLDSYQSTTKWTNVENVRGLRIAILLQDGWPVKNVYTVYIRI